MIKGVIFVLILNKKYFRIFVNVNLSISCINFLFSFVKMSIFRLFLSHKPEDLYPEGSNPNLYSI